MRKQSRMLFLLAMLAWPTLGDGAGITVVTAFPGNQGPGWKASIDAAGAVGPKHVVAVSRRSRVESDRR